MDQPTPDPASPSDPSAEPAYAHWPENAAPTPPDETPAAPASRMRPDGTVRRLQARIETADPVIAWTRGWVSREMRLHGLFAARTLDFAVLTERGLFLLNTGFFTRRPRRCVYAARLDEIFVSRRSKGRGVRLRITSTTGRPLWLELRSGTRNTAFADALVARTRTAPQ
jgi:hypothetical protein